MKARIMMLSTALSGGGAEQVTRSLAENLPDSICVVFENSQRIIPTSYRLLSLPHRVYRKKSAKLAFNLLRLICIQGLKLFYRPDVTISHLEGPNFANMLTLGGGKRVIVVHNSVKKNYDYGTGAIDSLKIGLVRHLYRKANGIVVVAPNISTELSKEYAVDPERIRYIANPVDRSWIKEQSEKRFGDWRDDLLRRPFIVNIASLTKQKNHELMIRSFHAISADYPDLRLLLLGKGCQEGKIRNLCAALGLAISDQSSVSEERNARVFLLGFQSNPYPFLAKSRLFLLPSLWEGLPIAMLEAMTLGKSLIVSDCSPTIRQILISEDSGILEDLSLPKEGLTGQCGYLMPLFEKPEDPDTIAAWAQAVRTLLDNPILQRKFEGNAITLSKQYDIVNTMHCWREMVTQMTKKDVAI